MTERIGVKAAMSEQRQEDFTLFIHDGQRLLADFMGCIERIRVYLNHHATKGYDDIVNQDGDNGWAYLNDPVRGNAVSPLPSTTRHIQGTNLTPNSYLGGVSAMSAIDATLTANSGTYEKAIVAWLGPYR